MFVATLDANVLFQSRARILLLRAAAQPHSLYRAVWSDEILAEAERALSRQLSTDQVSRAMNRIREGNEAALVTGYEALIDSMTNDPKDRHVLAVAVHAHAETIVTWNGRHFQPDACAPYNIQVQTPDEFLANLWDQYPRSMLDIVTVTAHSFDAPNVLAFVNDLNRLPEFTQLIRESEFGPELELRL